MEFSVDAIPMMATYMAQNKVMESVGTAMLSNTMDLASSQMADLTKAMELSVNPNIGANFDMAI